MRGKLYEGSYMGSYMSSYEDNYDLYESSCIRAVRGEQLSKNSYMRTFIYKII